MCRLLHKKFNNKEKEKVMAIKQIVHDAFAIAKNDAVSKVEVTLDTNLWSKRKQNIIVRAIESGVADCGYDTSWFIKQLLGNYGLGTERIHSWNHTMSAEMIKPDKLDEARAYVAALIRMREGGYTSWDEDVFMKDLDAGLEPKQIPIPRGFSKVDKHKFVMDYLKDQDEQEKVLRADLINKIRSGSLLTISFTI
jgi:hypothetical protein